MKIWPYDSLFKKVKKAAIEVGLKRILPTLKDYSLPAVMIELQSVDNHRLLSGLSHVGGNPDLPADFTWPQWRDRPLEFVAQINLSQVAPYDQSGLLPSTGMLSFFYDLEELPQGYDPNNLGGFRVLYFDVSMPLVLHQLPDEEYRITPCAATFSQSLTIPHPSSRIFDDLNDQVELSEEEYDLYWELLEELHEGFSTSGSSGQHRLLGHSFNVQNDMQLEAQLVSNGIYCGDLSKYREKELEKFEAGADDWILLFQLDSDDEAELMWEDDGMLYYWIRKQDLESVRFDRVWMTMQFS